MGIDTVDAAVQQDIQNQKALKEKLRMEQMPKGSIRERLEWGAKKSEMNNQQLKKNKTKYRRMEIEVQTGQLLLQLLDPTKYGAPVSTQVLTQVYLQPGDSIASI